MRIPSYILWLAFAVIGILLLIFAHHMQANKSKKENPKAPNPQIVNKQPGIQDTGSNNKPTITTTGLKKDDSSQTDSKAIFNDQAGRPVILSEETKTPVLKAKIAICSKTKMSWVGIMGLSVEKASNKILRQITMDENGTFKWPETSDSLNVKSDLLNGVYTLTIQADGFAPFSKEINLPNPSEKQFFLKEGGSLHGFGLKDAGIPIVLSSSTGRFQIKETDSKGEILFSNMPSGKYEVLIGDPQMSCIVNNINQPPREKPEYRHSISPGTTTEVDLAEIVSGLSEVSGQALGAEGGNILLRSLDGTAYLLRTHILDSNGTFYFPYVPPGAYNFIITPTLGQSLVQKISIKKGTKRNIEIKFPLAKIIGVIIHSDTSQPYPGIKVKLARTIGEGETTTTTGKNGNFLFKGLIPGPYQLMISSKLSTEKPLIKQLFLKADTNPEEMKIPFPEIQ